MKSNVLLISYLITLLGFSLLAGNIYFNDGFSAILLIIILLVHSLFYAIFNLFKCQQQQVTLLIRALANGDNTLGLTQHHPMRQQFEQVKQQMQTARFNAEQQAHFLQALLVHMDLAVLVCDNNGIIIESNPAVNKLLGKSIKKLHDLDEIGELIINSTKNMSTTSQWHNGDKRDTLSIQLSIATIQGKTRRVVSFQSIQDQLQLKEQQAYKRLTKVLTHEIANSITPLSSLAQTCISLLPSSLNFTDDEEKQDLKLALVTLSSRTQHLREFINRFRQMSSLPKPNVTPTDLIPILTRIIALYRQQASTHSIEVILNVSSQQLVMLDSAQMEQVVINLVKNSLEVLSMYQAQNFNTGLAITPEITLTLAQNNAQQYYLEVADNGPGIAEHVMDMIFVPFFTTKQEGSGIGLSLSRQIMQNHGGDLIYLTRPKGACFRCVFG